MNFTRRGGMVVAAFLATAFSAALFPDALLVIAGLVLATLAATEAVWMAVVTRRPERWYSVSSRGEVVGGHPERRALYPGETARDTLYFVKRVGGGAVLRPTLPFLKLTSGRIAAQGGATEVAVEFRTPFAGEYSTETLDVEVSGPIGLLRKKCALPAKLAYSVYPRTLGVVAVSAKLLGMGGVGDIPVAQAGIGTEFYEIREYQEGEDPRQINWMATARRGRLIANERMREVGAGYYLVLDVACQDYFDRDRLASAFLGLANALASLGVRFGFVVLDGAGVLRKKEIDTPLQSLAYALGVALDFGLKGTGFENELAFLPAIGRGRRVATAAKGFASLTELEEIRVIESGRAVGASDSYRTLVRLARESREGPPAIVMVSGMFRGWEPAVEAGLSISRAYGGSFTVLDPTAPWVVADDEREAAEILGRCLRKQKYLQGVGVDVRMSEPRKLVEGVLLAQ